MAKCFQNDCLNGKHFRVIHPNLKKEVWELVDFIPTYMVEDSIGTIKVPDAEKPHTATKLYNQLSESLNLKNSE